MAEEGNIGKELRPVNFGIEGTNLPKHPVDQFGQKYNADDDRSKWSGESPQDSRKLHDRADTDTGPRSLHHTLGPNRNQASPGDHTHDGSTSRKLGPLEMDPSNPGQTRPKLTVPVATTVADLKALLHEVIEFREV